MALELYLDSDDDDEARRARVYDGAIYQYAPTNAAQALAAFARGMLEDAFAPHDPRLAQHRMPVEEFAATLAQLKPAFIHHEESKRLLRAILEERGCDVEQTYFDVPRLRSSTSGGYLTSGIAYAFHPHRDTWYSAPRSQLNWWLPIYPMPAQSGMVFYPRYWGANVRNSSRTYNYGRWKRDSRFSASRHIGSDTREQPIAEEPLDLTGGVILNGAPGALTVFSAAQLHASARNECGESRFSIDFRTVHREDVVAGTGAPVEDSASTGTSLGDFLRVRDLAPMDAELVRRYDLPDTGEPA